MTNLRRVFFGILAGILVLSALPVLAQESDDGVDGEVTAGPQYRADDRPGGSAKFEEFRDVPGGFVAERFIFSYRPKEGYVLDLKAFDLTQLDQRFSLEFGKQDRFRAYFTWAENPRRWTDRAKMLYADRGNGVFTLDDGLQSAVQAAPASADTTPADGEWDTGTKGALIKSAIFTGANDVFVGFQRRTGAAGVRFTPTRSFTVDVRAERELRAGTTPQSLGMTFSLAPSEVAAPVDFKTDTLTVGAEFDRRNWNLGARLSASDFETGFNSLTWDNQLFLNDTAVSATSANPARGRLTLWTDSSVKSATVYGGISLPGHTRINATISRAETTQDDPFLPKTTNTILAPLAAALPATSFDGKFQNSLAELRVTSRPGKSFRWGAWARQYEFKNDSPELDFADYVSTDTSIPMCGNANSCGATTNRLQRRNLTYGNKRTNLGASAGFKPVSWLDATLALERESMEREFSAVEKSDEDSAKLVLDFQAGERVSIRSTFRHQERRADEYDAIYFEHSFPIGEAYVAAANEGMRKFYWTDRDRDAASLLVEVTPHPKFSIYAEATYADDTYFDPETGKKIGESFTTIEDRDFDLTPDPPYTILLAGRTDDRNTTYTLGFSTSPAPRFNIYGDYTKEKSTYGLESRYRAPSAAGIGSDDPLDNWGSDTDDRYATASLGFDLGLTKKGEWKMAVDASRSVGEGDIETHYVPGGNASSDTTLTRFPHLKTTLTIATLALTHALSKQLDYTLRYWYETWNESNWAADQMQPYMGDPGNDRGSANSIYLGMDYLNYENHVLSALMRYRY